MKRMIAIMLIVVLTLSSVFFSRLAYADAAEGNIKSDELLNEKLINLALSDEIARYEFSWKNDLGLEQNEFSDLMKDIGFVYAFDKLFSADPYIWEAAVLGLFDDSQASKIIAYKEMQKAVDMILMPDPKEVEMNQLYVQKEFQKSIDFFNESVAAVDAVTKPLDVYLSKIEAIKNNCFNTGQIEKALQAEAILNRYTFSVGLLEGIKGIGKGITIADFTSKTAKEVLKSIAIADTMNTRFEELLNLVETRYNDSNGKIDNEWDYALHTAANMSIKAYYENEVGTQILKFCLDLAPSSNEAVVNVTDWAFKNIPGMIWSISKVRDDVSGLVKASDQMMTTLASYYLQSIAKEEYYKALRDARNSFEPDGAKLNKLRLAGMLYLRSAIQTRNLAAESYDELRDFTTSGSIVKELKIRNDEAYQFLIRWQNALLDYEAYNNELTEASLTFSGEVDKVLNWSVKDDRSGKSFRGIGKIKDNLVAVGADGLIMISKDSGSTWNKVATKTNEKFIGIASDGERLVAATNRGSVFITTDGLSWETKEGVIHSNIIGIEYVNGRFVMLGDEFTILLSNNGIDWWQVSRDNYRKQPYNLFDIEYNTVKKEWIIAANNCLLITTDFSRYKKYELPKDCYMTSLGWFGNKLIITSAYGHLFQTENYISYVKSSEVITTLGYSENFHEFIALNDNYFAVIGQYGEIYSGTSVESLTKRVDWWETRIKNYADIHYVDNTFYAVTSSGSIEKSYRTDGLWKWHTILHGDTQSIRDLIVTQDKKFIAITQTSKVLMSNENNSFTLVADIGKSARCIVYDPYQEKYYIKGESTYSAMSNDGVNWEYHKNASNSYVINDMEYFNDTLYVLDGSEEYGVANYVEGMGYQYVHRFNSSPNAMALFDKGNKLIIAGMYGEAVIIDNKNSVKKVDINGENTKQIRNVNERLVAINNGGKISVSSDGLFWETIIVDPSISFHDIAYGSGRYVLVGNNGTILSSFDLKNWFINQTDLGNDLYNVAFNGKVFVVTGGENTILVSDRTLTFSNGVIDDTPPKLMNFSGIYEVKAGDSFIIPGSVTSNTKIKRITLGVIGWYDSYDYRIPESKTYELSDFVLDTSNGILSKPGVYEVNVWVKTEGYRDPKEELGRLTLIVKP